MSQWPKGTAFEWASGSFAALTVDGTNAAVEAANAALRARGIDYNGVAQFGSYFDPAATVSGAGILDASFDSAEVQRACEDAYSNAFLFYGTKTHTFNAAGGETGNLITSVPNPPSVASDAVNDVLAEGNYLASQGKKAALGIGVGATAVSVAVVAVVIAFLWATRPRIG